MIRHPVLRVAALHVVRGMLDAVGSFVANAADGVNRAVATLSQEVVNAQRRIVHELQASCDCNGCTARRAAEKKPPEKAVN